MYLKIWLRGQIYLETIPDDSGGWRNKWVHQSLEEISLGLFRHLQRPTFVNSQAEEMQMTFQMTVINYTLSATWDARSFYVACKGNFSWTIPQQTGVSCCCDGSFVTEIQQSIPSGKRGLGSISLHSWGKKLSDLCTNAELSIFSVTSAHMASWHQNLG